MNTKNIIKVYRFKDNTSRLYQLPDDMTLDRGVVVDVEFGRNGVTACGLTVSKNYLCDDTTESMIRDLFHMPASADFKKVVAVYEEKTIDYLSVDAAEDAEEDAEE